MKLSAKTEILRAARLFCGAGEVHELRALHVPRQGTVAGYFDDPEALAQAALDLDDLPADKAPAGIYVTLNPVLPDLLARASNRAKAFAKTTTTAGEVLRRCWLLIDADPVRPRGVSATDEEHQAALARAEEIREWLDWQGWPDPAVADSGNGGHLVYRLDLPNDDESGALVSACLKALHAKFADAGVDVDVKVSDPNRICKLYGTMARKGDHTPDRPHRRSHLLAVPEQLEVVTADLLQELATLAPAAPTSAKAASTGRHAPAGNREERYTRAALDQELDEARMAPQRNNALNKAAFRIAQLPGLSDSEIEAELLAVARANGLLQEDGETAVLATIRSGIRGGRSKPRDLPPPSTRPARPAAGAWSVAEEPPAAPRSMTMAPPLDDQVDDTDALPVNLHDLRKRYVLLVNGGGIAWDLVKRKTVTLKDLSDANAAYFNAWKKDENMQKVDVDRLVFAPEGTPPGHLNIFRGLQLRPNPDGCCERMVRHLAWLCGDDPGLTHWLTCWLAYPLQHVGAKLKTAVVMHGAQGSGKNLLFDTVQKIYGEYGHTIYQPHLDQTYTDWASGKLFVIADEVVSRAGRDKAKNLLKGLITGDRIPIRVKYQADRYEANHLNMVFLSNEDVPVLLDSDDRRFCVINVDRVEGADYYRDLAAERDAGGLEAFYAYLLEYDCQGFDEHAKPPRTAAKDALIRLVRPSAETFLEEWQDETLPIGVKTCATNDLHGAYQTWCALAGETAEPFVAFSRRLSRVFPGRVVRAQLRPGYRTHVLRMGETLGTFGEFEVQRARESVERFQAEADSWRKSARSVKL